MGLELLFQITVQPLLATRGQNYTRIGNGLQQVSSLLKVNQVLLLYHYKDKVCGDYYRALISFNLTLLNQPRNIYVLYKHLDMNRAG